MESKTKIIISIRFYEKINVERKYREKKKDATITYFGLTVYIYKRNS